MGEKMARDAVAEAWASIDGKLDEYIADREASGGLIKDGVPLGYYEGYQSDAAELIKRIANRGYVLSPPPGRSALGKGE